MNDTNTLTPAARLDASRARVRAALQVAATPRGGAGTPWLDALKSIPGSGLLLDALRGWWSQHPLHDSVRLFSGALQSVVRPLAQRHPLALVAASLVVGGLLAAGRPWRWILTPTLLAGLLPQLLSKAVALVPAQSWLAVVASLAQPSPARGPARAETAPEPGSTAGTPQTSPVRPPLQH